MVLVVLQQSAYILLITNTEMTTACTRYAFAHVASRCNATVGFCLEL
jgi:hypothetical protein